MQTVCTNELGDFFDEYGEITPKEAETITRKSAVTVRRHFKMLADTSYIVAEGNTNNILIVFLKICQRMLTAKVYDAIKSDVEYTQDTVFRYVQPKV